MRRTLEVGALEVFDGGCINRDARRRGPAEVQPEDVAGGLVHPSRLHCGLVGLRAESGLVRDDSSETFAKLPKSGNYFLYIFF